MIRDQLNGLNAINNIVWLNTHTHQVLNEIATRATILDVYEVIKYHYLQNWHLKKGDVIKRLARSSRCEVVKRRWRHKAVLWRHYWPTGPSPPGTIIVMLEPENSDQSDLNTDKTATSEDEDNQSAEETIRKTSRAVETRKARHSSRPISSTKLETN